MSTKSEVDEIILDSRNIRRQVVGYIRVSTIEQDVIKQREIGFGPPKKATRGTRGTIEQDVIKQREIIDHHCKRIGLELTKIVKVEVSTRKKMEDRELGFLNALREGDTLICTETSRLSRSLQEITGMIDSLLRKKVRLIFVLQGLDISDLKNLNTRLMLNIFAVIAEHERSVISLRTREALEVLKRKGVKLGKPKGKLQRSYLDEFKSKIKEWCKYGVPFKRQAMMIGGSVTALRHYIATRRIFCNPMMRLGYDSDLKRMHASKGREGVEGKDFIGIEGVSYWKLKGT